MTGDPIRPSAEGDIAQRDTAPVYTQQGTVPTHAGNARVRATRLLLAAATIALMFSLCLASLPRTMAQGDPTQALIQTLSNGIRQQFTLTAQAVIPITLTSLNLPTETPSPSPNATDQRQTLQVLANNQLTLTYTALFQATLVAQINQILTLTAQQRSSLTPVATLNPAQQQQTLNALAGAQLVQAATNVMQTAVSGRVGELLTATAQSGLTLTPALVLNATQQQQTMNALIASRFPQVATGIVQTAISNQIVNLLTATAQSGLTLSPAPVLNATQQQQTMNALVASRFPQVATGIVQTAISNQINNLLTATAQSGLTLTPALVLNATDEQQTMNALVASRFPQAATGVVQTAISNQVNTLLTATALSVPVESPTSPNSTALAQTQISLINTYLTQTAQVQSTQAFNEAVQATVLAINAPGLTTTAQAVAGDISLQQQTLTAYLGDRMTQTAQFQALQTAVVYTQPTSNAIFNQWATTTAQAAKATLTIGLEPITAGNATRLTELAALKGHTAPITAIAFNPLGTAFASSSSDNTVRLWDVQTHSQSMLLNGVSDRTSVAFSPDGQRVVSGSSDGTVRVWDIHTGAEILTLMKHRGKVMTVAFSPDGTRIASGSADRTIILWDAKTGAQLLTLVGHLDTVTSLAFSPDGLRLVSGSNDSTVRMWEVSTGFLLSDYFDATRLTSVAFSPDGASIVTANRNGLIQLRSSTTGVPAAQFNGHTGSVAGVVFSPDGKLLVSAGSDTTLRVWDIGTRVQVARLDAHYGPLTAIAFSPDSAHLILAAQDNVLRIWGIRGAL